MVLRNSVYLHLRQYFFRFPPVNGIRKGRAHNDETSTSCSRTNVEYRVSRNILAARKMFKKNLPEVGGKNRGKERERNEVRTRDEN